MFNDVLPPKRPVKNSGLPPVAGVAADDDQPILIGDDEPEVAAGAAASAAGNFITRRWRHLKSWWSKLGHNTRFGIIAASLLVFGVAVILIYNWTRPQAQPSYTITKKPKPVIKTVASPLTGVQVDPSLANRPVTGIMIENSTDARPQSGLQDAGIVYEAIAEAGITRFLALFQDATPQYIGPVRSLRPYYIDFAAPYQASIVHVGGSPDALAAVQAGGFRNLDQFANGSYFTRIAARAAPHNVYTSFDQLDKLNAAKGYTSSQFTPWPRKADQKLATPTSRSIDFQISSSSYYVHYDYDAKTNSYLRSEGGAPHLDLVDANDKTGVQLKPKVVIALLMPQGLGALDSSGAYYTTYQDSGSGQAYIFQDGGETNATWAKADTNSPILLTDDQGHGIKLDAGQTWVTILGSQNFIHYSP